MGTDTRTPSQIEQDREAATRNQPIRDERGNDLGPDQRQDAINDGTGNDLDPARAQPPLEDGDEPERQPPQRQLSPGDAKRAEIAARFKRNKDGYDDAPFNGNPNDPEMQYGRVAAQQLEPEPGASIVGERTEPEPAAQPQMITRKVRGVDVTKTLDQWLDDASKVSAADSYLEEGRALLEDARKLRNSAQRTGQNPQHPEDQTGTQDDDLNPDATSDDQHPDALIQAIEEIQFGDPKDAARKIRTVIEQAADQSSDKRQIKRLRDNDLATSQSALKEFMDQNPALAKDEDANVLLENYMYRIYREDLEAVSADPATIPKDNNELAELHRELRINGHKVRTIPEALKEAKARFDKFKGVTPTPGQQQSRQPQKPRIEVDVNRTARREAIQNQPTRAVAPRPDAVRQAPERKSRQEIIMDMRKQRRPWAQ